MSVVNLGAPLKVKSHFCFGLMLRRDEETEEEEKLYLQLHFNTAVE